MIDRSHSLCVVRQARELRISRCSVYYLPAPVSRTNLAIMRHIDELHLDFRSRADGCCPTCCGRKASGSAGGACHYADEEDADQGDLSPPEYVKTGAGAQSSPLSADRAVQSSLSDGYQLRSDGQGFVYLMAIVDRISRKVLVWRVSNTIETDFWVEALEKHLSTSRNRTFLHRAEGQSTSMAFTSVLRREDIAISMDGWGASRGNVVVERLWRSVKRGGLLPRPRHGQRSLASIARYLTYHNAKRPHSSLGAKTPDQAHLAKPDQRQPA